MKIWIFAKKENQKNYENKRFAEEAAKMKIKLDFVSPEDFEIIEPRVSNLTILYKHKPIELPDCVIPRMGSGTTYFGLAVLRQLEQIGVCLINHARGIESSKDKLEATQILSSRNIPIPKTMLAKSTFQISFIKREFHFPIVVKPISGSEGRGILLCETPAQLEDVMELIQKSSDGRQNIILQEFISDSSGKDIRVFVVGGRAIGAMLRRGKKGSFKANFSTGGTVELFPLSPEVERLAVESARALGLDIAGVDVLFDKEGHRICEVNSSPYFKGFEEATKKNIPREIFKFAQICVEERKKVSDVVGAKTMTPKLGTKKG